MSSSKLVVKKLCTGDLTVSLERCNFHDEVIIQNSHRSGFITIFAYNAAYLFREIRVF